MDITVTSARRGAVNDVMIHLSDTMSDLNLVHLVDALAAIADGAQPVAVERLAVRALHEALRRNLTLTRWQPGDDHVHITARGTTS